ncbi:MAG: autotransporter outer membrane beta-barrel domain-containing protein [Ignavibacteria bacterium]|nr:autotransporter outer membrane beta-barrel domain-containing protein [Ignavibacteria bacterium]
MRTVCIWTALLLLASASLISQEDVLRPKGRPDVENASAAVSPKRPFVLGIEAGVNFNFMSQPYTSTPQIKNSPEEALKSGSGISPEFGVFADMAISSIVGIQARVAFDQKYATNTKQGIIDAFPPPGVFGPSINGFAVVPMETEARYALTMNTIAAAVLARINVIEKLFVTVGPYATYAYRDVTRSDRLTWIGPPGTYIAIDYQGNPGVYTQIERKGYVAQNLLPRGASEAFTTANYSNFRIGFELGAGYRIDLTKNIYLAPNLRYQWMITELNSGFTASDNSQPASQTAAKLQYDKASLNSLALILQLGFTL